MAVKDTVAKGKSKLYAPFLKIGHITNSVPFSITSIGQKYLVCTVSGNTFQIYDASNLNLLFVSSPPTPSLITCIYAQRQFVYASWDSTVGIFFRGRLLKSIVIEKTSKEEGKIKDILVFGQCLCVSTNRIVYVYRSGTNLNNSNSNNKLNFELYTTLSIPNGGNIIKIVHLPTYLNKILVVCEKFIFLFNIRTARLLFSFDIDLDLEINNNNNNCENDNSIITCVEAAPAIDIIALGLKNGNVIILNIKTGKVLFHLKTKKNISSISFRSDLIPHILIATSSGTLMVYDLCLQKRLSIVENIHNEKVGGISHIKCFNGQPIFITSGNDNSIKEFVFDDFVPKLLRFRAGHFLPPSSILFAGENNNILSGSFDKSLWCFSTRKSSQNIQFSQRDVKKNSSFSLNQFHDINNLLPEIIAIAYQSEREGDWENVLTAHKDLVFAQTWNSESRRKGRWIFKSSDNTPIKSICISKCGNFGAIGSTNGLVDVFHMQSGIHRRTFGGHNRQISGIAIDSLNKVLISASFDGSINFHDFNKTTLIKKLKLQASVTKMLLHTSSDLLAVSLDNISIVVIDISTMKVIREFWGHENRITSFTFTPDSRWIISSSLDSTIRTWDIPSGTCIDFLKLSSIVTDLSMSRNGEWLATVQVGDVGINLWTNKSQFYRLESLQAIESETDDINKLNQLSITNGIKENDEIEMPSVSGNYESGIVASAVEVPYIDTNAHLSGPLYSSPEQIDNSLITLSNFSRDYTRKIIYLDIIKQRNKPTEPLAKPEKAPFFLFAQNSIEDSKSSLKNTENNEDNSVVRSTKSAVNLDKSYESILTNFNALKNVPPSSLYLLFSTLDINNEPNIVKSFLEVIQNQLRDKTDYELVQSFISVFLYLHETTLADNIEHHDDLMKIVKKIHNINDGYVETLSDKLLYNLGVINFIRINR